MVRRVLMHTTIMNQFIGTVVNLSGLHRISVEGEGDQLAFRLSLNHCGSQ